MNKKNVFRYTLAGLAEKLGITLEVIRDHKQSGRFNPDDFASTARYFVARELEMKAKETDDV